MAVVRQLWTQATTDDESFMEIKNVVRQGQRRFPAILNLKVSVSDCTIDDGDFLCFRGRRWVPNSEPLRTKIIELGYNGIIAGHPGRHQTYVNVANRYFWPNLALDVRRLVRNCDICGRTKPWRQLKQSFLKPLPIADQQWQEQSIDFVVELPTSYGNVNLMVVTDRLGKGAIIEPLPNIEAETVAWAYVRRVFSVHGIPRAIVSDRGKQFTGHLWRTICRLIGIQRRVSTAFHPQTDGSTERKNSDIEVYLRTFINHAQNDWARLCPLAELSLNGRISSITGVSPFFLSHGYELPVFQLYDEVREKPTEDLLSAIERGEAIVRKLQQAND